MDAAIYPRLSRNRHGLSDNIQIQIAEGHVYAEEKLWTVVIDPETTADDDISASKFSTKPRPGYDRLLAAIEAGQVEVIICTEMTRLYRKLEELLELIKMAERTRLKGIWTTDDIGYDLSTPEGVHAAIAAINNAQLESAKLSKRQKRKKAAQARQGMSNGGGRPFGFDKTGMELVPEEVTILIEAKDRYLAGETMRDIVRDFYSRGVLSPYGKPWQIENFQRVLFNRRYLGIRVHNEAEYPALWPAIFTQGEWERMNTRRLAIVARYPGKQPGTTRQYLLTGLLYCGGCGKPMIGSRRKTKDEIQRRYRCRHVDNYGQPYGCGKVFRGADPLDLWVTEAVLYRFDVPEVADLLGNGEDKTSDLLATYQEAKGKLDQMVADYASGFLTREQFAVAKTTAERNLESARQALARVQTKPTHFPASGELIREAWATASVDWKHSVIALIVERVILLPGHPGSHRWKEWRFQPDFVQIVWRS